MKKTIKKIIASLLVAVLVLTAAPLNGFVGLKLNFDWINFDWLDFSAKAHAQTSGIFTYYVYGENATITDCYESASGIITIPSEIDGYTVTRIEGNAFYNCNEITGVIIPNTIEELYYYSFYECNSITSFSVADDNSNYCSDEQGVLYNKSKTELIKYPVGSSADSYTVPDSVEIIHNEAFFNARNLSSLLIGENVKTIGDQAFYNCSKITSLEFPNSVEYIGYYAFYNLSLINTLFVPDSVEHIGHGAFCGFDSLTNITLPFVGDGNNYGDNSSVFGFIFGYNESSYHGVGYNQNSYIPSSLKSVTITKQVNIPYHAFYNCSKIKSITLPASLKSIGSDAFSGCNESLLDGPEEYEGLVVNYNNTLDNWCDIEFSSCYSNPLMITHKLKIQGNYIDNLIIPDSVTEIKDYAFCGADIKSVTLHKDILSVGTEAFYVCKYINNVSYTGSVNDWLNINFLSEYSNPVYYSRNLMIGGESLTDVNVTSAEKINSYAFINLESLKTVNFESDITSIGAQSFDNCVGINSIILPDSVASIGTGAFQNCKSLGYVVLGNSLNKISDYAFSNTGIQHVFYTGNESKWNLIYIGQSNEILTEASKHNDVDRNINLVTLVQHAVPTCINGGYNTYRCEICNNEFINVNGNLAEGHNYVKGICTKCGWDSDIEYEINNNGVIITGYHGTKSKLVIPDNLCGVPVTIIGKRAFFESSISSVIIPNSVTSIDEGSFSFCPNLNTVTLGNNVKSIGNNAFDAFEIKSVYYLGSLSDWCNIDFASMYANPCANNATLYINDTEIKDIIIPDGVTKIKKYAFCNYSNANSIYIPNSVTEIGEYAFSNCGLYYAILGNGVNTIADSAFYNNDIQHVFYSDTEAQWNESGYWFNSDIHFNVDIDSNLVSIKCIGYHCNVCDKQFKILSNDEDANHNYVNGVCSHCGWVEGLEYTLSEYSDNYNTKSWYEVSITGYTGNKSDLIIPDNLCGMPVSRIDSLAGADTVTKLTIPDSVTYINSGALRCMTSITDITIPYVGLSSDSSGNTAVFGTVFGYQGRYSYYSQTADTIHQIVSGSSSYCYDYYIPTTIKRITITNQDYIPYGAFSNCSFIESINYEKELKTIGAYSFYGCSNLSEFILPKSISSISDYSFAGCSNLNEMLIPDTITSIGNYAFAGLSKISELIIPDSVNSIGEGAFNGCNSLEKISVPFIGNNIVSNNDSASVFGYIFGDAGFDSGEVEPSIEGSYQIIPYDYNGTLRTYNYYCKIPLTLKEVIITSSTVINPGSFSNCLSIEKILFNRGISKVGAYAFYNCEGLTEVTIPDGATEIGEYTYSGCSSLTGIDIPNSVIKIGESAFSGCSNISEITLPDGLNRIERNTFSDCSKLRKINIPDNVSYIGENGFYYCSSLDSIIIPNGVQTIGRYTFYGCENLSSIDIPDSVTVIGEYAFAYTTLESLFLSSNVTKIGKDILSGNNHIEILSVPFIGNTVNSNSILSYFFNYYDNYNKTVPKSLKTVNVTNAIKISNNTFRDCESIENITLNERITSIGTYAFYHCSNLKEITIPDSVTEINDCAFNGCSSLKSVDLGNNPNLQINYNVFDGCDSVNSYFVGESSLNYYSDSFGVLYNKDKSGLIKYPAGSTYAEYTVDNSVAYINENAFENSINLKSVSLPNDIISIGAYAFRKCTGLESIVIPEGTYTVCYAAFEDCTGIKEITLPASLNVLGNYAFNGCTGVEKINYNAENLNSDEVRKTVFNNCGTDSSGIELVFSDTVETIPESLLGYSAYSGGSTSGGSSYSNYGWNSYSESYCRTKCNPNVTSITIGNNVNTICDSAFANISTLKTLNYNAIDCSFENKPFAGCSALENIVISDSVKRLPNNFISDCDSVVDVEVPMGVENIGDFAFSECDSLQTVRFENTGIVNMGNDIFRTSYSAMICCYENSYMHFYAESNGIKYCIMDESDNPSFTVKNDVLISYNGSAENVFISSASKIGFGAFSGNDTVKTVELSTSVTRIFNQAFKDCSNLSKIIIPKGVSSIGEDAFSGCNNLTIWCYPGSYAEAYAINHDIPIEYIMLIIDENRITLGDSEITYLHASYNTEIIDTQNVSWTSSDSTVATVDKDGRVVAKDFGTATIIATSKAGLSSTCIVNVDVKLKDGVEATITDDTIVGNSIVNNNVDEFEDLFANSNIVITSNDSKVGTGDVVTIYRANGDVYKELNVLIFGDVNGDGVYDGMDSMLVSCIANGLLSESDIGEAVYMAADCNHDGVIDQLDVDILNDAGVLLASVDQTKSEEELLETSSAYVEYLNLIDQTVETETTEVIEEEPVDSGYTFNFFDMILNFIKEIITVINSVIAFFK